MQHLRTAAVPLAILKASAVLESQLLAGDGDAYEGGSRVNMSVRRRLRSYGYWWTGAIAMVRSPAHIATSRCSEDERIALYNLV